LPDTVYCSWWSDNGPQCSLREFSKFAKEYGFEHSTSSPQYPQANGEAGKGGANCKGYSEQVGDLYLALLTCRATPINDTGYSSAELLMSRKLRTTLPMLPQDLKPRIPDYHKLQVSENQRRDKQKQNFDKRHAAHSLIPLKEGTIVWIPDHKCSGKVVSQEGPHSYKVLVPSGTLRRNRRHFIVSPKEQFTGNEDLDLDFMPHLSEDINGHSPQPPEPPIRMELCLHVVGELQGLLNATLLTITNT